MTAEISLRFDEELPSDSDFFGLDASVACRGFGGHTAVTVARRDIQRFLAEAASLQGNVGDSALLVAGVEVNEVQFRLQVARAGLSGQFVVRARLASPGPSDGQWDRVETEFITPPTSLTGFLNDLERMVGQGGSPSASLTGDAGAAA